MTSGSACTVFRKDGGGRGVLVSILISEFGMARRRVFKRAIELRNGHFAGGHAVGPARLFDVRIGPLCSRLVNRPNHGPIASSKSAHFLLEWRSSPIAAPIADDCVSRAWLPCVRADARALADVNRTRL